MSKTREALAFSLETTPAACGAPPCEEGGPILDLVHLSRQTLGDDTLEAELLGLFDRQAGQFAARLAPALRPGEEKWRADLAHTLKGSARAVGAVAVARAAEAYEAAARADGRDLADRWAGLDAAIADARSAIAQLFDRG
jgi:HPt (histidine-containing phosphotransfer) domain-containing protein